MPHKAAAQVSTSVGLAVLFSLILVANDALAQRHPALPGDPPTPPGMDPRSSQPDIVVILLDDVPPLDGRLWQPLPNIRRYFVQQAVEFTDAHGETPTCCPGRAGFLTGLHTHHHGAYKTDGRLFKPGETIATALSDVGYHTIQVGKYLNLFEYFPQKWPPGWSEFHGFGGEYFNYNLYSNGRRRHFGRRAGDYSTDVITRLSVKALRKVPTRKPIFAWITPYSMHKPWQVAPRHHGARCNVSPWRPRGYMERDVRDKPAYIRERKVKKRHGYGLKRICRGLLSVDQLVGNVVRELQRQERLENTMLILTSDNGMAFGSHRILHDKKAPYTTQIPFFVRWPRVLGTEPRRVDARIQNIDLAPTLCDVTGCRLGPYPTGQLRPDGVSFLDVLTGEEERLDRTAVLSSYQDAGHRVPTYWSVTSTAASPLAQRGCAMRHEGGCRWLYAQYETGERELYDISNGSCWTWKRSMPGDPCMLTNRAGKRPFRAIERALRRELAALRP